MQHSAQFDASSCLWCDVASVWFWCRHVSWRSKSLKLLRCLRHRQTYVMSASTADHQRDHRYVTWSAVTRSDQLAILLSAGLVLMKRIL